MVSWGFGLLTTETTTPVGIVIFRSDDLRTVDEDPRLRRLDRGQVEDRDLFDAIVAADAIVISFAEHNGHYTAAYKNTFDWASRIDRKAFGDKPAVLLSAVPGGCGSFSTCLDTSCREPH